MVFQDDIGDHLLRPAVGRVNVAQCRVRGPAALSPGTETLLATGLRGAVADG